MDPPPARHGCPGWRRDRFLHVEDVSPRGGYTLRVRFDDGVTKDVDLEGELHGPIFEPLRDAAYFRAVAVNAETGTIEWPDGADFAPEFLFETGRTVQHAA